MQEAHKIGYTIVSEGDVSSVSDTSDSEKIPRLLTGVELGPVPLLLKYSLTFSYPKEMNSAMRRKRFGPK